MAQPANEMIKFLEKYILIWTNYKNKYLTPSVDDYYNFARYLQKIDKEKWVINFYQIEMFPKLKRTGDMMSRIKTMISTPARNVHGAISELFTQNAALAIMVIRPREPTIGHRVPCGM